jgi:CHAT domain-containing protein
MFTRLVFAIVCLLAAGIESAAQDPGRDVWTANGEAVRLYNRGQIEASIPVFERALALAGESNGLDRRRLARIHHNLALAYWQKSERSAPDAIFPDAEKAVAHFEQALAIWTVDGGASEFDRAVTGLRLAHGYNRTDRFVQALPLFEAALPRLERRYGSTSAELASALAGTAYTYHRLGRFSESEKAYTRSLSIYQSAGRPAEVIKLVAGIANAAWSGGDYYRAARLFEEAVRMAEKAHGTESPTLISLLGGLAGVYRYLGQSWRNDVLYARQDAICRKHPSADPLCQAGGTTRPMFRAIVSYDRGDFARAIPIFRDRLAQLRTADLTQSSLFNEFHLAATQLATIYERAGDYRNAAAVWETIVDTYRRHPHLQDRVASAQLILAKQYDRAKDVAKADALYAQLIPELEERLQRLPAQPRTARERARSEQQIVLALAEYYAARGRAEAAVPLLDAMLDRFGAAYGVDSIDYATALAEGARVFESSGPRSRAAMLLQKALSIIDQRLGSESPGTASVLSRLARHAFADRDARTALGFMSRALTAYERNLSTLLSHGSEGERRAAFDRYTSAVDLAISLQQEYGSVLPDAFETAFGAVLHRKGRLLGATQSALTALRERGDEASRRVLEELSQLRALRASMMYGGSPHEQSASYRARFQALRLREDELERASAKLIPMLRAQTDGASAAALAAHLEPDEALVDFVVYRPYDAAQGASVPARVLAYVLRREGAVKAVDLGPARDMAAHVKRFRGALSAPDAADVDPLGRQLYTALMAPLETLLEGVNQLCISPDGVLNLMPFEALLDSEQRYLVERYRIRYISAARDLAIPPVAASGAAAAIFGDPAYGATDTGDSEPAPGPRSSELMRRFTRLPETEAEAEAIAGLIPAASLYKGPHATETQIKQVRSPRILHIATHGFFLPDPGGMEGSEELTALVREDPLVRSGLALACANSPCPGTDDGILTALEATTLHLDGTELVVLSACDTGVGDIVNGDGIYGLRRAFVLAGARQQIISLWKVDDAATRELMTEFYQRFVQGASAPDSLRAVQLRWARDGERRHPFYWASFVLSGREGRGSQPLR